jgi:hypothetical protein
MTKGCLIQTKEIPMRQWSNPTANEYPGIGFAGLRLQVAIKKQDIYNRNTHETIFSPTENEYVGIPGGN